MLIFNIMRIIFKKEARLSIGLNGPFFTYSKDSIFYDTAYALGKKISVFFSALIHGNVYAVTVDVEPVVPGAEPACRFVAQHSGFRGKVAYEPA